METRRQALREILQPRLLKWGKWVCGFIAAYDVFSAQARIPKKFEPPTILEVVGMSGSLLPWWDWLLVAQAGFVYGLFEYVRRNLPTSSGETENSNQDKLSERLNAIEGSIEQLQGLVRLASDLNDTRKATEVMRSHFQMAVSAIDRHQEILDDIRQGKLDGELPKRITEPLHQAGRSYVEARRRMEIYAPSSRELVLQQTQIVAGDTKDSVGRPLFEAAKNGAYCDVLAKNIAELRADLQHFAKANSQFKADLAKKQRRFDEQQQHS